MRRMLWAVGIVASVIVWPVFSTTTPRLLAGPALCTGTLGAFGWQCETVDDVGDVGDSSIIRYTAGGTTRIAYNSLPNGLAGLRPKTALKHAERVPGGSWSITTADSSAGSPGALLQNPSNGLPQIGYDCLRLATYSGTAWSSQAIVSKGCGSDPISLAYDGSGTLWAAYSDGKRKLVVGRRTGSSWTFQTLPTVATYKSLAIMADGQPAIAFGNDVNALVFAHREVDGRWTFTTVEQTANSGYSYVAWPTLLVDADGTPTIGYCGGAIRLARLVGGSWVLDTARPHISDESLSGLSTTLANGEPVMSFSTQFSGVGTTIRLLRKSSSTGSWVSSSVEVQPASYVNLTSVAYDATRGVVGVSYGPRDVNDLRFAEGPVTAIGN